MAPAVLAIGAAFTWLGGVSVAGVAIGGILQGAVIGAAIGGISSAITGGDIGKGILFGAIGGAVTGGIASYASGAGGAGYTGAVEGVVSGADEVGRIAPFLTKPAEEATKQGAGSALGSILGAGGGSQTVGGGLAQGAMTISGNMLAGMDASEEADKLRIFNEREAEKNRIATEKLTAMRLEAQHVPENHALAVARMQQETAMKQLGENRRQYNVARTDVQDNQKRAASALEGLDAARKRTKVKSKGLDALEIPADQLLVTPDEQTVMAA